MRAEAEGQGLLGLVQKEIWGGRSLTHLGSPAPPTQEYTWAHLDCTHVHGVLDDVTVVMQAQCLHIHRLVERPGVGSMLLGEHLLEDATAALELL